jgi:hypothetical protein
MPHFVDDIDEVEAVSRCMVTAFTSTEGERIGWASFDGVRILLESLCPNSNVL